jgi:hypothetical protein
MNTHILKLLGAPKCKFEGAKVLTDIRVAVADVRKVTNTACIFVSLVSLFVCEDSLMLLRCVGPSLYLTHNGF